MDNGFKLETVHKVGTSIQYIYICYVAKEVEGTRAIMVAV